MPWLPCRLRPLEEEVLTEGKGSEEAPEVELDEGLEAMGAEYPDEEGCGEKLATLTTMEAEGAVAAAADSGAALEAGQNEEEGPAAAGGKEPPLSTSKNGWGCG